MVDKSISRQHQILGLLLENKNGLSIDHLAKRLDISRAAVQQHFVVLERDGFIRKKQLNKTGGRPVSLYELTNHGINYFPKQYAWLTGLVLESLEDEIGPERVIAFMQKLGHKLAGRLQERFQGKDLDARMDELAQVMNELGFQVKINQDGETGSQSLQAFNCVYHDLAQKQQAVCEFDLALMSSSLDQKIMHASCMARGDCSCKFVVGETRKKT